jgi:hypothetical protein
MVGANSEYAAFGNIDAWNAKMDEYLKPVFDFAA